MSGDPVRRREVDGSDALFVLVAGWTDTARVDGISAAGTGDAVVHTPSADAELITYGHTVRAPGVPFSPTGCPTPALVTRAAREVVGFETCVVDGGLRTKTGAPTVSMGARPGRDIREADPVQTAPGAYAAAREFGATLDVDSLVVGETVPGGTTTALAVMRALGEEWSVSSSLPDNPLDLKHDVVEEALRSSDLSPGEAAHHPELAARFVGDPVLAVVSGLAEGAAESGTTVTLGGGTQMLAAAALVRHAGCVAPLELATTSFLDRDVPDLEAATRALDLDLTVTDPGFSREPLARFDDGEAKEGAGMGGALALAARAGLLAETTDRTFRLADRLG